MIRFPSRILVTGTDTGVGKTVVAAGLVAWLRARGVKALGWKPVESGTRETGRAEDAELLRDAAGLRTALPVVYPLGEPLAPVVAARRSGVAIVPAVLDVALAAASTDMEVVVVEGVGGALVEVAEGLMVADLPSRWDLDVLVVAANRLGVLSHTLLTVEAVRRRGGRVLGVVLNTLHGDPPDLAERTNLEELSRLLPVDVPVLAHGPWISDGERRDPAALAAAVEGLATALQETIR